MCIRGSTLGARFEACELPVKVSLSFLVMGRDLPILRLVSVTKCCWERDNLMDQGYQKGRRLTK